MNLLENRARSFALGALALAMLTACGEGVGPAGQMASSEPTQSPETCDQEHARFFVDILTAYPIWIKTTGLVPLAPEPSDDDDNENDNTHSPEDERARFLPVQAEALREAPAPASLTAPTSITERAVPEDQPLIVGVSGEDFGGLFARLTESGPAFFGNCASIGAGREFARFAAQRQLDGAAANDALIALVVSPEGPEAAALRAAVRPAARVDWSELDPMDRFLDVEARPAPPDSVQRTIERVPTVLRLPTEWASYPFSICTRVDEGWGECSALSAAEQTPTGAVLPLLTYATQRGRTEYWVVPDDGRVARRLGRVLTLAPGFERAQGLRLRGEGAFKDADSFAEAARRGAPLLAPGR